MEKSKSILEIDNLITEALELTKELTNSLEFEEVCKFKIREEIPEIPWSELNHQGLYLFEVKNDGKYSNFQDWVTNFRSLWEDTKYKRYFTPNFKLKRINAHQELKTWIPLYLGKSKKIKDRVKTHLFKELLKPTFAMKLVARENLRPYTFRLNKIRLEVKNYDAILPKVENQLRDRINPLIGKQ